MNRIASKQGLRKKFNNHQMVEHVKHVKNFWERDETYHVLNTKNLIFSCEASLSSRNLTDMLTNGLTVSYFQFCCYLQTSDEKTSFTKRFSLLPRSSRLIFLTGNGILQTGNGIIFPISRPPIKKLLL